MPRVVLLHGLGADHRAFQRFARLLPQDWSTSAIDLLGHGPGPHPDHGYRLDDHARHVAARLSGPTVLVGHSYGAATAIAVAALHPELVEAVVLLDPVVQTSLTDAGSRTSEMVAAKRAGTLAETVARSYPDASQALQRWTVETWEQMSPGVLDELDGDWMRFADRVTAPTALVHGDVERGGAGDLAADWLDDPLVVRIAGAGHYLHATHARETAAAVARAVSELAAR